MKLIFHSVLLISSLAIEDSSSYSDKRQNVLYTHMPKKKALEIEYDPQHKSHFLDADPHLLDTLPEKPESNYHNNFYLDNDLMKQLEKERDRGKKRDQEWEEKKEQKWEKKKDQESEEKKDQELEEKKDQKWEKNKKKDSEEKKDKEWEKSKEQEVENKKGQEWEKERLKKKNQEWQKKENQEWEGKKDEELAKKYHFDDDEVKPKHSPEEENVPNRVDVQKSKSKRMKLLSEFKKQIKIQKIPNHIPKISGAQKISSNLYRIDPVLNAKVFKNSRLPSRRKQDTDSSSDPSSSSREMKDFKDEFRELWLQKKFEAINQSRIHGDKVNMVAARPWGVPCGDPNQHDMPWGVCMMNVECEPEFRVYRGDLFCGRTQFICCAIQLTTYDMYQGFDVSFDDKSLSTDSDEKRDREKTSKEKRKKKKGRERKQRRKAREERKKKIKKHIKKIVKEIKKILNKQYRNGTRQRKRRTKQLKKFVKDLKKQYRKDRQSIKDLHENDMMHIDSALMERLKQIQKVNNHFATNETFREVVLKGTMTKKVARMLLDAYPELDEFLEARRAGGGEPGPGDFEYDLEYGYLYY